MKIIEILSGMLTPVIAVVTAYIMIQQYKIEKRNYRFQLFTNRHEIYTSTMAFIASVVEDANSSNEGLSKLMFKTRDVNIFFEDDISEYISKLYKRGNKLVLCNKIMSNDNESEDKKNKYAEESLELGLWFATQFEECKEKFSSYLDFRQP